MPEKPFEKKKKKEPDRVVFTVPDIERIDVTTEATAKDRQDIVAAKEALKKLDQKKTGRLSDTEWLGAKRLLEFGITPEEIETAIDSGEGKLNSAWVMLTLKQLRTSGDARKFLGLDVEEKAVEIIEEIEEKKHATAYDIIRALKEQYQKHERIGDIAESVAIKEVNDVVAGQDLHRAVSKEELDTIIVNIEENMPVFIGKGAVFQNVLRNLRVIRERYEKD